MTALTLALAGEGDISAVHAMAAAALGDVRVVERAEGADVVFVCSEVTSRTADALEALGRGAAVILEKPLGSLLEADQLVAVAETGGWIAYGENLAHAPVVVEALARLPALGEPHHLEVRATQAEQTWGEVAAALLLADRAPVSSVSATSFDDERAELSITFESGLTARIESAWRHDATPVWDFQVASATGVLRGELLPAPSLEHNGDPVALPPLRSRGVPPRLEQYGYLDQLRSLLADFRAGRPPSVDVGFGRTVLAVVAALTSP